MNISKKTVSLATAVCAFALSFSGVVSAHVVVNPTEATTATYQTFTVSVPVEKDQPTVGLKLQIPQGVQFVTPTVKPGWTITTDKTGTGEDAVVKSITWSEGAIGADLRDEFTFSAKTPDAASELRWKAYQTYQDGTVVSWDQPATGKDAESEDAGPLSVTKVTKDSVENASAKEANETAVKAQNTANQALYMSVGGILVGFMALFLATRKK